MPNVSMPQRQKIIILLMLLIGALFMVGSALTHVYLRSPIGLESAENYAPVIHLEREGVIRIAQSGDGFSKGDGEWVEFDKVQKITNRVQSPLLEHVRFLSGVLLVLDGFVLAGMLAIFYLLFGEARRQR